MSEMEKVFVRSQEVQKQSMDAISESMTQARALEVHPPPYYVHVLDLGRFFRNSLCRGSPSLGEGPCLVRRFQRCAGEHMLV